MGIVGIDEKAKKVHVRWCESISGATVIRCELVGGVLVGVICFGSVV